MVQFLDLTLRRCQLLAWQHDLAPGVWWCLLRWSVRGELRERWYVYDWQKVRPIPAELPDLDVARSPGRLHGRLRRCRGDAVAWGTVSARGVVPRGRYP
jgi:hypothetical protein